MSEENEDLENRIWNEEEENIFQLRNNIFECLSRGDINQAKNLIKDIKKISNDKNANNIKILEMILQICNLCIQVVSAILDKNDCELLRINIIPEKKNILSAKSLNEILTELGFSPTEIDSILALGGANTTEEPVADTPKRERSYASTAEQYVQNCIKDPSDAAPIQSLKSFVEKCDSSNTKRPTASTVVILYVLMREEKEYSIQELCNACVSLRNDKGANNNPYNASVITAFYEEIKRLKAALNGAGFDLKKTKNNNNVTFKLERIT